MYHHTIYFGISCHCHGYCKALFLADLVALFGSLTLGSLQTMHCPEALFVCLP